MPETIADVFINSFGATINSAGHFVPARKDMNTTAAIRMYGGNVQDNVITFKDGSAIAWMESVEDWYYA